MGLSENGRAQELFCHHIPYKVEHQQNISYEYDWNTQKK